MLAFHRFNASVPKLEMGPLLRKLAVIIHADVVDSTALVRLDESLAHQRIQDTFRRFSKTIENHEGTAHEIRGDALIAEFAKASDAVAASIEFQADNSIHVQDLPGQIRPLLRVGVAMGEVVVADDTVTGEGVVLAQRLEQMAKTGGVCIQGAAYETVPKRLPYQYQSLGELEIKGFVYKSRDRETEGTVLVPTNTAAKQINTLKLNDLPGQLYVYNAEITGKVLANKWKLSVPGRLELKVGAKIILLKNNKPHWVNGDLAEIVGLEPDHIRIRKLNTHNVLVVNRTDWEKLKYTYDYQSKKIEKDIIQIQTS